jgi:hypothetical protein
MLLQRVASHRYGIDPRTALRLQSRAGNRAVAALLSGVAVQRGGKVAQAGPEEELEYPGCGLSEQLGADDGGLTLPKGPGTVRAGSGTCNNGGGFSSCNWEKGIFSTTSIDNTCCTKPCTERHEAQHVTDYTNWGCCKKLSERKDSADFASHKEAYARWSDTVRPISECRAYKVDVKCATEKKAELKCGTPKQKPENTDCCEDLKDYIVRYQSQADEWCAKAPATAPLCPPFI